MSHFDRVIVGIYVCVNTITIILVGISLGERQVFISVYFEFTANHLNSSHSEIQATQSFFKYVFRI